MKKAFIDIKGMDCASDAATIEMSLLKVRGVKSASINYLIHKGFANIDDKVNENELKIAVSKVGYKVTSIRFEDEK